MLRVKEHWCSYWQVCDNVGDHLIGNVYARYEWETEAQAAVDNCNQRWYAGKYSVSLRLSIYSIFCPQDGLFMLSCPLSRTLGKLAAGRMKMGNATVAVFATSCTLG